MSANGQVSKLRPGQFCPVHSSYFCCGRSFKFRGRPGRSNKPVADKWEHVGHGVFRKADEHHPRGYREKRTPAAMRDLVDRKIAEQKNLCAICGEKFTDRREVVGEHIEPKGMGGARADDHPSNIQAAHNFPCNVGKGSRRLSA